jgi:hypothetical protein
MCGDADIPHPFERGSSCHKILKTRVLFIGHE